MRMYVKSDPLGHFQLTPHKGGPRFIFCEYSERVSREPRNSSLIFVFPVHQYKKFKLIVSQFFDNIYEDFFFFKFAQSHSCNIGTKIVIFPLSLLIWLLEGGQRQWRFPIARRQ